MSKQPSSGISRSSFYLSFFLLTSEQREGLKSVYAFCRESDDRVDSLASPQEKRDLLAEWRQELEQIYSGHAAHPAAAGLIDVVRHYEIPKIYFEELLQGMAMDIERNRYGTYQELDQYCYGAASTVGLICLRIFGVSGEQGREYAIAQGKALQLTNILRDVRTDLQRDRIYFPKEDFIRFNYSENEFAAGRLGVPGKAFLDFQIGRARDLFSRTKKLFPVEERSKLNASRLMASVYEAVLDKIADDPGRIFIEKVRISKPTQAWLALKILAGR